jgi:hypothetical protein
MVWIVMILRPVQLVMLLWKLLLHFRWMYYSVVVVISVPRLTSERCPKDA